MKDIEFNLTPFSKGELMLTLGRKMSVQTLQWMQVIIAYIKLACVSIKAFNIDPMV